MPLLEISDLTKYFGGLLANNQVSFAVEEGEIVGLIGPNGAGKTTLFNCIAGYYRPERGQVVFRGETISGRPPHSVCWAGIGRTFQIMRTFREMTVLENVMVGAFLRHPRTADARRVGLQVLERVGFADKASVLGRHLTTAGKKRVELARSLATNPTLIMLDEVMAGLNQTEVAEATAIVRDLRDNGTTILMVEHVMEALMPLIDRAIVLDYGRKIFEGTPEQVVTNDAVITAYLGDKYYAARS